MQKKIKELNFYIFNFYIWCYFLKLIFLREFLWPKFLIPASPSTTVILEKNRISFPHLTRISLRSILLFMLNSYSSKFEPISVCFRSIIH